MWFSSWLRNPLSNRSTPRRAASAPAPRFRPQLESLEDRLVPSFTPGSTFANAGGAAVVTADLNGDGKLDLITASGVQISVQMGDGKGGFAAAKNYAAQLNTNGLAVGLAVGDFNGDGKLDVVTSGMSGMNVLLGNGDGTFKPALNSTVGPGAYVTAADINGDGKLDLIGNSGGVKVLLGNGDGTFRAGFTYALPVTRQGIGGVAAVGDFNADGKLDLITKATNSVSLMTGKSDGTFNAPQVVWTGGVTSVAVADFNSDTKPDLAVGSGSNSNSSESAVNVEILKGNGDGTFARTGYGYTFVHFNPMQTILMAADVNHDGKPDLVALTTNSSGFQYGAVALGTGSGFVYPQVNLLSATSAFPGLTTGLAVGDFNGDGYVDVVVVGHTGIGGYAELFLWKP